MSDTTDDERIAQLEAYLRGEEVRTTKGRRWPRVQEMTARAELKRLLEKREADTRRFKARIVGGEVRIIARFGGVETLLEVHEARDAWLELSKALGDVAWLSVVESPCESSKGC